MRRLLMVGVLAGSVLGLGSVGEAQAAPVAGVYAGPLSTAVETGTRVEPVQYRCGPRCRAERRREYRRRHRRY